MDTILLEDICNRIKAAEDPYNIMEWLEQDLIHIAILPKTEYPGLTANKTSSFYLAEYLEAYLEKGYQLEEIIEGIKIILCKMKDKMNKELLINEIKACEEEITNLENKRLELKKQLLYFEKEDLDMENTVETWIAAHIIVNEGYTEEEIRVRCLKGIKEELSKLKSEEDLDSIDITSYNFIYMVSDVYGLTPEEIIPKVENDLAAIETD